MQPGEREPVSERLRRSNAVRMPMLILGITMCIFYIALGTYLWVNKDFLPNIPKEPRNIFAGMVFLYGLYRGWRLYTDYR